MQKYQDSVIDARGRPISGAVVTVTQLDGSPATIYGDNGVTTIASTLSTGVDGSFAFYADDGHYSITISGDGFTTKSITDILIEDHGIVTQYADAAAASASAAAVSEANAETAQTAAAASAAAATAAAAVAQPYADDAAASAAAALVSETNADTSEAQAAAYAAAAATGAKFYDTIALGRAGVADTFTFGVKAGGSDGLTRPTVYRRDSAGTQTLLFSVLPASEYDAEIVQETLLSYSFTIRDYQGNAAFGVKTDGTVAVNALEATTLNGSELEWVATAEALSTMDGVTPLFMLNDELGKTALEVLSDGSVAVANLQAPKVNGLDVRAALRPDMGSYDAELVFFINSGQSLGSGPEGAVTISQEYDNIGFADSSSSPVAYLPLTAANCSQGGNAETPLFGALGIMKALLAAEKGLVYTAHNYQLLGADNSMGSYSIIQLNKGTTLYNAGISQAASAASIAATENRSCVAGAVFWTQGEHDSTMAKADYQGYLQQLAIDYNTDLKAATGQTENVLLICYQCCSPTDTKNVPLAQLAAANAEPLVHVACPTYQFDYLTDGVHLRPDSSKWLGAYYGLVYQRIAVDGVTWAPVQPLSATKQGKVAYVSFSVPVKPLVIDTEGVAAQANYGFTLVTSADVDIPITSVSVSSPDVVKIVASTAIPAGAKLRYGFTAATGLGGYTGGAGNLRDSQGETVTYRARRMDNWCVLFEFNI